MDTLVAWLHMASEHIIGIPPIPTADTICLWERVLCCDRPELFGLFGSESDIDAIWRVSSRVVPVTDCHTGQGEVIVNLAGMRAASDLSNLPAPPEFVKRLDLTDCEGSEPADMPLLHQYHCLLLTVQCGKPASAVYNVTVHGVFMQQHRMSALSLCRSGRRGHHR